MASKPPEKSLKPTPGGWFIHPFEIVISGSSGAEKTAFIRLLVQFLKNQSLSCGIVSTLADQVILEQEQLLNDLVLIDSDLESAISHFVFLDSSADIHRVSSGLNDGFGQKLLGIIGNKAALDRAAENPAFSSIPAIPKLDARNLKSIAEIIQATIQEKTAPLSTLLLAGGKSSRMGRNKTGIRYRDEPQILRTARLLAGIGSGPVTVSIGRNGEVPAELEQLVDLGEIHILADQFDGFGPMGGILTAMRSRPNNAWLVSAVDLPLLEENDLSLLLQNRNPLSFATAFGTPLPEPLFTIYEPKSMSRMLALLGRGVNCPRGFLKETPHQQLELSRPQALFNANTPGEMEEARKLLKEQSRNAVRGSKPQTTSESVKADGNTNVESKALSSVSRVDAVLSRLNIPNNLFPSAKTLPLKDAVGRILAESVFADRDQPPFNRAAMDGIAVQSADLRNGLTQFSIQGILPAGSDPGEFSLPQPGDAVEIMTGAPLPEGYDSVIRYEYLEITNDRASAISNADSEGVPWKNVHRRGSDFRQGKSVIAKGRIINSAVAATLAGTGCAEVSVESTPKLAIFSTGSELVPVDSKPLDWQIRQSNLSALSTELKGWGIEDVEEGHLKDNKEQILEILESEMNKRSLIILSGGVSKGKYDYIPSALTSLGVETLVHGVAQKPGKPLLVGLLQDKCIVFALPGNPVASIVNLRRYLVPLLCGRRAAPVKVKLETQFRYSDSTTQFLAVKIDYHKEFGIAATGIHGNGSGDFFHLLDSDGFIEIPAGFNESPAIVDFYAWAGNTQPK